METSNFDPAQVAAYENAAWSRAAETYDEGFGRLVTGALPALLDAAEVRPGSRVLDLGCGTGLAGAAAARRAHDVIGIDFSETMVEKARELHPQLSFRVAAAEELPFEDATFDSVIANFVVHHSGDPDRLFSEARRVLAARGRFAFTVWSDPAKLEAFSIFFSGVEEHAGAAELPHGPLFGVSDPQSLQALVRRAGFRGASVRELQLAWDGDSLESYLKAFAAWAGLEALGDEVRGQIERSVRRRAEPYRKRGRFSMPNPALLVVAET